MVRLLGRALIVIVLLALMAPFCLFLAKAIGLRRAMGAFNEFAVTTSLLLGAAAICALPIHRAISLGRLRLLMLSGIAACGFAGAFWIVLVWSTAGRPALGITATVLTAWALLHAAIALLFLPTITRKRQRMLRQIGVMTAAAACLTFLIAVIAAFAREYYDASYAVEQQAELLTRVGFVLVVLSTSVGIAMVAVDGGPAEQAGASAIRFEIICPRCDAHSELSTGKERCPSCGLAIKVTPL